MFYKGTYADNHWAVKDPRDSSFYICTLTIDGMNYAVYLNPTDCRGYRQIVRLVDYSNMQSTFNRKYTQTETEGLYRAMGFITSSLQKVITQEEFVIQTFVAGNNAQSIKSIGSSSEPNVLHGHIVCRGFIGTEYVEGYPLIGSILGENFDMRNPKVSWNPDTKGLICFLREVYAGLY
jgi:hypothetical protein